MTAISSLLSSTAAMPPPVSAGAAPPSLASFLDLLAPVTADLMPGKRQADAGSGKTLPVADDAAKGSEDPLAWLGVAIAPTTAMVAPTGTPLPGADGDGVQATGSIVPAAGMMRVGATPPSPVEPLVAPPAVSLPGSNGVASMAPGARTAFVSVADGVDSLVPSSTAQRAPAATMRGGFGSATAPEPRLSRAGEGSFSPEPLAAQVEASAGETEAVSGLTPGSDGVASMTPVTRTSRASRSDGVTLPSPASFTVQHASRSTVRDVQENVTAPEQIAGRTNMPSVEAGAATDATDESALEPLATPIGAADAIATLMPGRWAGSNSGSASLPGNAVAAALASQAPVVQHGFAQIGSKQPQGGLELPNVPATAPIAVSLPGVNGTAMATPVAGTPIGEALSAPVQVTASGTPARLARDVIISNIGQPNLRPVAPVAIDTPVIVGERGSAAASIVQPDAGPRSGFLPVGVLATGTPVEPRAAAPAALVFADAIHHALGERDSRGVTDPAAALAPVAPALPGVAATGAAQGALDMRHEHWPAAMIERIVTLRDMAAENDTRLRLSPDMLGTIDVSLRRDGDQVQVQISAEQAQTRQMLAEAQPRLAELADARGVKLQLTGAPGGGAGHAGSGDAPRQQPAPAPFSTRPRSVAQGDDAAHDERIA